jgi:hypothetical protein
VFMSAIQRPFIDLTQDPDSDGPEINNHPHSGGDDGDSGGDSDIEDTVEPQLQPLPALLAVRALNTSVRELNLLIQRQSQLPRHKRLRDVEYNSAAEAVVKRVRLRLADAFPPTSVPRYESDLEEDHPAYLSERAED